MGTRNIGMGGRSPWGIHPMHNQAVGTSAFMDGKTVIFKKDGDSYMEPEVQFRTLVVLL